MNATTMNLTATTEFALDRMDNTATAAKNGVLDTHNDQVIEIAGVAVLKSGVTVALFDRTVFCLNLITPNKDGGASLSTMSVGGNVDTREVSLEDAINEYNYQILESLNAGWPGDDSQMIAAYILF